MQQRDDRTQQQKSDNKNTRPGTQKELITVANATERKAPPTTTTLKPREQCFLKAKSQSQSLIFQGCEFKLKVEVLFSLQ